MLKANASVQDDANSSVAGSTSLPANKLSQAKDFAAMLGHAQVNFLSSDNTTPAEQGFTQAMPEMVDVEQVADDLAKVSSKDVMELPPEISIGNVLPETGKAAPLDGPLVLATADIHEDLNINKLLDVSKHLDVDKNLIINQDLEEPDVISLSALQSEGRSGPGLLSSGQTTQLSATGALPDAITRINEFLQANVKPQNQVLSEAKPVAPLMSSAPPPEPLQGTNTLAQLKSAYSDERAGAPLEGTQKLLHESKQASSNSPLSGIKTDALPADLQTPPLKSASTDGKSEPSSGALSELKPAPGRLDSDQRLVGVVKSADESSAPSGANPLSPVMLKSSPGNWVQQGELKGSAVERASFDPLQTRVDPQPVNAASLMQRHVEQRLAAQGSDTKRLQADVAAALDARVSAESTDRPVVAPARIDPSTSVMPKLTSTPTSAVPEGTPRQLDTAVQDQILRVMSRQALAQGRLTLQLNPHELGSLDIEFSTEKGEVQVAIVARETSTRDLLEASVARLRQSLQDVGVNVGQLDIRQGDRHSNEQGARESMQQDVVSETSTPGLTPEDAVAVPRREEGGIHIYV